ncbi:uncharacterized protein [Linepithema humile]|uniref:uncharacterized protein n=1 Tax=Linepithema humile TaxID=83485 RepID=UPI00351E7703
MSTLKETWTQCRIVHASLLQACPEEKRDAFEYFRNNQYEEHKDIFQNTLGYMAECLEEIELVTVARLANNESIKSEATLSLSHLSPIKIPSFFGNFEEWESFCDRFQSLIINNTEISAFARMHFLTSSLTGRALESIKNIPVTANNFESAWKTLVSRYENKRRLIEMHISSLMNLPTVSRENSSELIELIDKVNRALASLKNLNRSLDNLVSDILVYSVTQKLDPVTRKAWKFKRDDDSTISEYEELKKFILSRSRTLDELNPTSSSKASRVQKVSSATASATTTPACPLCKASHFINKCPQFIKKNATSASRNREAGEALQ